MYYPFFRGKQFELITIRENSKRMANHVVPIIEPVKQNTSGLQRALEALVKNKVKFILISNPQCGELCDESTHFINNIIEEHLSDYDNFSVGYIVNQHTLLDDLVRDCRAVEHPITILHFGFQKGRKLAATLKDEGVVADHIFIEDCCSKLYRKHFKENTRVLIRDGFNKRTNRNHPDTEHFSDLHITYDEENVDGFGDFLIVGNEYSESGGPAYTVAIHLTYIDTDEEDDMFINHYKSDRTNTPVDPGGKFLEALEKLVQDVDGPDTKIFKSNAVKEYIQCHKRGHYPGLGYVKKLSMQHHIELILNFLDA